MIIDHVFANELSHSRVTPGDGSAEKRPAPARCSALRVDRGRCTKNGHTSICPMTYGSGNSICSACYVEERVLQKRMANAFTLEE